jgi:serine protease Do
MQRGLMMKWILSLAMAAAIAAPAFAEPTPDAVGASSMAPLPLGVEARPVALTRVGSLLRNDQKVGTVLWGAICIEPVDVTWAQVAKGFVGLQDVFREELTAAGFKPDKTPGNLFADNEAPSADLQVGAMMKSVDASGCQNTLRISSKMALDVEWQVYSTLRREVVLTVTTHGTAQRSHSALGSAPKESRSIEQDAFVSNVRALLADERFRTLVTAPDGAVPPATAATIAKSPITLIGGPKAPVRIAEASGAVVEIFAQDSFGSGVLVSTDGYILTAQHVVGDMKTVRIRWSDGFETTGQVMRTDKRRDVALIRSDTHGRSPLRVQRMTPELGASVFAIGAPLDPKLQNTVTRGVISGQRIIDGFNFIQSDTQVTHGNSGGPLLNGRGEVIGITDLAFRPDGENEKLNFFIPAGDALDFLGLKAAP